MFETELPNTRICRSRLWTVHLKKYYFYLFYKENEFYFGLTCYTYADQSIWELLNFANQG